MDEALKSYPARWIGPTLLACKKCQKKLKKAGGCKRLAKLRKSAKKLSPAVHVVDVGCMDLCPKGGVAVCKPESGGDRLYVVRSVEDVLRV